MATVQTRQDIPADSDEFTTPSEAARSAIKIYIKALGAFVEGIPGDDFGYAKKIEGSLSKAIEDGASAPAAFIARLGRAARSQLTAAEQFIQSAKQAAAVGTQDAGFGIIDRRAAQAGAASSVGRAAMKTIGEQVSGGDDVASDAKEIFEAAVDAIEDAEKVILACETDYGGPSALRFVGGNDTAAIGTKALFEMLRTQVMANAQPMRYANTQLDSLLTIEDWAKCDAFVDAVKPLIVETLGTPQPVLAARRGANGPQNVWDGEHALAAQLGTKIEGYERARRPAALRDGPMALDAIKQLFSLITGTSAVWLNRGQRETLYRSEQRDAGPPWPSVAPQWQQRWVLPVSNGMTLGEWTKSVQRILVPISRTAGATFKPVWQK